MATRQLFIPGFEDLRSESDGRPVAAPLYVCARLLDEPLAAVERAASRVAPYFHADGSPRWSVRLLERELGRRRLSPLERRQARRDEYVAERKAKAGAG